VFFFQALQDVAWNQHVFDPQAGEQGVTEYMYSVYNPADSLQAMIIKICFTSATISAALPFGHLIIGTVPKRKH